MPDSQPKREKRCACGAPTDGWPSETEDNALCQMCWESECAESFWQFVAAMDAAS